MAIWRDWICCVEYEGADPACPVCGKAGEARLSAPRIKRKVSPDSFTAAMLGIPEKELPPGLRQERKVRR